MESIALRMYGKMDLRLEKFGLPDITDNEILAEIISDTSCPSTYKAVAQGPEHPRVPNDIDRNPVIVGHEMAGRILKVGKRWRDKYQEGQMFTIQPALLYEGGPVGVLSAPGYSYKYLGGLATKVIIPSEVMEQNCLLPFDGDSFFKGSLVEPISCIVGAVNVQYHTKDGSYEHIMGIKKGGKIAILGGAGPMGIGFLDYFINGPQNPKLLVITDIDGSKLERAKRAFPPEKAKEKGIDLRFVNPLKDESYKNIKYDDVFVLYYSSKLVEEADFLLDRDGCLNFFAGPIDHNFSASINFFKVHYDKHHIASTSGGNADDMWQALELISKGILNLSPMISHIGGINAAKDVLLNFPKLPGGKKLIYTHLNFPLSDIDDFERLSYEGEEILRPIYRDLYEIVKENDGWWCAEAERYLLGQEKLKINL
ncbi:MAG TPA: zinc-binding dehydrogenase [Dictyoglomaceae bacterium]|nr:zinc-binding dehydrogenase [Dictyoglomaceae bacterium]HPU43786.1 zinc-binding dehydrogenase [Dictyoglomaceae bacterium]